MSRSLTPQLAADQIVTALEGGSNYWLDRIEPMYPTTSAYADAQYYGPHMIPRSYYAEEDDTEYVLNWTSLQRGFRVMREKYPWHWDNMTQENGDAETADVFLQCALLGEIVYG